MTSLTKTVVHWGICGTGAICHDFTASLTLLPEVEHKVAAVASRKLDASKAFTDKFGIQNAYGSYEELVNDENIGWALIIFCCICIIFVMISQYSFIYILL